MIPIKPPKIAFIAATTPIILVINVLLNDGKARSTRGASFCHVDRIRAFIQEMDVITDGNQKWQGTAPSFRNKAVNRINIDMFELIEVLHWLNLPISIRADPKAWARKYLRAASVSWFDFMLRMRGINLIKFSSIATQARNQLGLDRAISVLATRVDEKMKVDGVSGNIKTWRSWTPK